MALKAKVKVGNITNLSDARYCAGMGVDMLGFAVIAGSAFHLEHTLYQEIRGWISGPSYVAQLEGLKDAHSLAEIVEQYQPDYLEVDLQTLEIIKQVASLPLIVKIGAHGFSTEEKLISVRKRIAFVEVERIEDIVAGFPHIITTANPDLVDTYLRHADLSGISLSGSDEVRPGFKDYEALSEILEKLEAD